MVSRSCTHACSLAWFAVVVDAVAAAVAIAAVAIAVAIAVAVDVGPGSICFFAVVVVPLVATDATLLCDDKSDLILLGVSRTSKTPTSIYLANRGYKTLNIPLVNEQSIPESLKKNPKLSCVVGLTTEPQRLVDIRKNRMNALKEKENTSYTNISKIEKEINEAKKTFTKYKWPIIDVTRKSVEETAASIIKIYEIKKNNG